MTFARLAAATAAVFAAVAAGCGVGEGETTSGEAALTVTRDYGQAPMLEATVSDPSASETVIRFLDREAEITTRFGGGFVHSIDGVAGGVEGGRSSDWFFFVNGIESDIGAAEVEVRAGDRIWWDYRDWTAAMRAPAVVGSWPEPFLQASTPADERVAVQVACMGVRPPCEEVGSRLAQAGVEAEVVNGEGDHAAARILVGTVRDLAPDKVSHGLAHDPATSGVFARLERPSPSAGLEALNVLGDPVFDLDADDGLIAALRPTDGPVTWLVTATGAAGVRRAAEELGAEALADRYAVVISDEGAIPLPARDDA
jgi:hypothetical protein